MYKTLEFRWAWKFSLDSSVITTVMTPVSVQMLCSLWIDQMIHLGYLIRSIRIIYVISFYSINLFHYRTCRRGREEEKNTHSHRCVIRCWSLALDEPAQAVTSLSPWSHISMCLWGHMSVEQIWSAWFQSTQGIMWRPWKSLPFQNEFIEFTLYIQASVCYSDVSVQPIMYRCPVQWSQLWLLICLTDFTVGLTMYEYIGVLIYIL